MEIGQISVPYETLDAVYRYFFVYGTPNTSEVTSIFVDNQKFVVDNQKFVLTIRNLLLTIRNLC